MKRLRGGMGVERGDLGEIAATLVLIPQLRDTDVLTRAD